MFEHGVELVGLEELLLRFVLGRFADLGHEIELALLGGEIEHGSQGRELLANGAVGGAP